MENLVDGLLELTVCVSAYGELRDSVLKIGESYVRCILVIMSFYKRHGHIFGTCTTVPNRGAETCIRTHTQTCTRSGGERDLFYLLNKLL